MKKITILGIDPGTQLMGWGLIESCGNQIRPLKYGCIVTKPHQEQAERLCHIHTSLCDIINTNKPDCAAIEELFYFKNQKTIISVAQARGVALFTTRNLGLSVFEYTPLQVKQAITGYGRAEKKQVQEMVRITCGLETCPKPDDAADALAIAICHAQSHRLISLTHKNK